MNRTTSYLLSFILLLFVVPAMAVPKAKLRIGIVPIGNVAPEHVLIVQKSVSEFYRSKVDVLPGMDLQDDCRSNPRASAKARFPYAAYNAYELNNRLAAAKTVKYDKIIGIMDSALTLGPEFWSEHFLIRGLAFNVGQVATVSTFKILRESNERYPFDFLLTKVVRHELGHVLGLPHCDADDRCFMVNGLIAERFHKANPWFCQACREKINRVYLRNPKQ